MVIGAYNNFFAKFISNVKNLYGRFGTTPEGFNEYYLKLDGYYYCNRQKCYKGVIRVRNKRTTDIVPIKDIVNDKEYLKELHPVDACIIGIIANNERHGIIDKDSVGWKKMRRLKECHCFIRSDPILEISKRYTNGKNVEMTVLRSKCLNKEIEIATVELCKNQALLYALDSFQAIAVGYGASESFVRSENFKDD